MCNSVQFLDLGQGARFKDGGVGGFFSAFFLFMVDVVDISGGPFSPMSLGVVWQGDHKHNGISVPSQVCYRNGCTHCRQLIGVCRHGDLHASCFPKISCEYFALALSLVDRMLRCSRRDGDRAVATRQQGIYVDDIWVVPSNLGPSPVLVTLLMLHRTIFSCHLHTCLEQVARSPVD